MSRGPGRTHEETRQAIVERACSVVAEQGVEALTYRRVAIDGVSPGRVQHYFPDRATLVRACFDEVQDRAMSRVQDSLGVGTPSPFEVVRAVLRAMIPRGPEEVRELRVMAMFETLALTEPALHQALRDGHAELRHMLAGLVAQVPGCKTAGATAGAIEPAVAVTTLLAVAEGLSGQVLHGHLVADDAFRTIDETLARVLGGSRDSEE
jgi:AcrR family transcriptional regulator